MKRAAFFLTATGVALLLIAVAGSTYTVRETEHVIITQFGRIVGQPVSEAGLHFKLPFIQTVNRVEKRALNWDGNPIEIPTKDKAYIRVDTFARWRIVDPELYFLRLHDERSAQSRLEDILGSETRNYIARHELIEIVRTDKTRKVTLDDSLKAVDAPTQSTKTGQLPSISTGRAAIEKLIKDKATPALAGYGLELLDLRFKRINYNDDVLVRVYQRMISERQQIAQRFRSEGEAGAARIDGDRERDLNEIESAAYKTVQQLRGEADAEASRLYAEAFNRGPEAAEFYGFMKTLETYRQTITPDTTLLFSTDSDIFRLLKHSRPAPAAGGSDSPAAAAPQ